MNKQKLLTMIFGIIVLVMIMFGCPSEQTVNQLGGTEIVSQTAYITIGLNEIGRAANPTVTDPIEFDKFVLSGTADGGVSVDQTWDGDGTTAAYTKMTTANVAVTVGATYSFTLTAIKGGAIWSGTAAKTISIGQNSLSFALTLADLGTVGAGEGNINITLRVPSVVKNVTAELVNFDTGSEVTPTDLTLDLTNNVITYKAKVGAGIYELVLTLFGDAGKTLKLAEWREAAGVADGNISSSSSVIDTTADLDSIYSINYDYNGGEPTGVFSLSYTRHSAVTLPTENDISRTGYTFGGWYVDSDFNGEPVSSIQSGSVGTKNFYAKWTANQYIVTLNNGDGVEDTTIDVTYDTFVPSITKPSKIGYTFGGYWTEANGQGKQYINENGVGIYRWNIANNTTLYAKWTPNQYAITYKDQGDNAFSGTFENDIKPTTHTYGSDTPLVAPTKEHYRFDGWYIESDCFGSSISTLSATGYTDTITLYAKWTPIAYTVIFNANNKTDGTDATSCQQIFCGESALLNSKPDSFTKDGFSFVRWCDCKYGVGKSYLNEAAVKVLTGDT
ncbi:MAG: InlB B-repeat-containing protein, partial [Spirochaetales bacterium]|nr:InlB B-repeat-containing protein [Spirochaetales bacterium]